jgi:hypothetical protein
MVDDDGEFGRRKTTKIQIFRFRIYGPMNGGGVLWETDTETKTGAVGSVEWLCTKANSGKTPRKTPSVRFNIINEVVNLPNRLVCRAFEKKNLRTYQSDDSNTTSRDVGAL